MTPRRVGGIVTAEGKVLYLAEKRAPRRFPKPASSDLFGTVARNFQVFDPLDFIAELTMKMIASKWRERTTGETYSPRAARSSE